MKKTIFLVVLGLITVFCICFGTYKHLGGFASAFKDGIHIDFDDDNYDDDYDNEDFEEEEKTSKEKRSFSQRLEKFSSIKIDAAVMGLRIEDGDNFHIESNFDREYLKPEVSVSGDKLVVRQKGRNHRGINIGSQSCKVVITIPSGTSLNNIDINSNVGDIAIRDLQSKDIAINLNVGEINVRNVDFDNIQCNNNVGEISINPLAKLDDYDMSLATDIGEVRVAGRNYKRSYNSRGNGKKKIRANTNVGEIKVK